MDVTAMGKALSLSYDKALSGIAGIEGGRGTGGGIYGDG